MNVLAIGAHPDDIEFGCGGSLIQYSKKGHAVFLLIVTEGESGGTGGVRRAERNMEIRHLVLLYKFTYRTRQRHAFGNGELHFPIGD